MLLVLGPRLQLALLVAVPHRLAPAAFLRRMHVHLAAPSARLVRGGDGGDGSTLGEGGGLAGSAGDGGQRGQTIQDVSRGWMGAAELCLENGESTCLGP